jgi:hypothetical protein
MFTANYIYEIVPDFHRSAGRYMPVSINARKLQAVFIVPSPSSSTTAHEHPLFLQQPPLGDLLLDVLLYAPV